MKRALPMAVLLVSLAGSLAPATSLDGLEGIWEGFLAPSPLSEIRVILRVDQGPNGALRAQAESPELKSQPPTEFDQVELKDGLVTLTSKKDSRTFRGKLEPSAREMTGELKGTTGAAPITFARLDGPYGPSDVWEGSLEVNGGIKLRLAFHARKVQGGAIRATMDSPDQGAFGLKVDVAEISAESVKFTLTKIGSFEGKPDSAGTSAVGHWKQGGRNLPLTLKKGTEASVSRRTQTPKAPFPYASEAVSYESRAKGVRIAGTLTVPEGQGPFPTVLLITGSGPQDRDETLLGHKPFFVLADDLTRRGIAVLRVDDRGVGESTGDQRTATSADFAEDVLGGVDFLKGHPRDDPKRIGLIGHSEGGLIAPDVASRSGDVAFLVLLAGPGLPGDEILSSQLGLILKAAGAGDEAIRRSKESQARLMTIVKETPDLKVAAERIKAAVGETIKALPEAERKAMLEADPSGSSAAVLASPWFRYFLNYDPRPALARVRCPILAINGEKDLQVPCRENLEAIEKAVRSGGNTRVTTRAFPGLNHLFQPSQTGAPSEYSTIEETFAPTALRAVGDWILEAIRGNDEP